MATKRRGERTRCVVAGRPGPGVARSLRCLDPTEADRLVELGEASFAGDGDYDSEDECEARCTAFGMLPPTAGAAVAEYFSLPELSALQRTSRATSPVARAQLEHELRQCNVLRGRYPEVWGWLLGGGRPPCGADPDRARSVCQLFGLPCVRPYTEVVRRLSDWELTVPAAVGTRMYRTEGNVLVLPPLGLPKLVRLSPTTARMAARPAPVRDRFPQARGLPVLLAGDSVRLADSPLGERVFVMGMRADVHVDTTADGLIRVRLWLYNVGPIGQTHDATDVTLTVAPFPAEALEGRFVPPYVPPSREALRGDHGPEAQRLAMTENAYVFALVTDIGAPYALSVSDDDPPQYVLDRAARADDYLVEFFDRYGFPFDGLSARLRMG